MNGTISVISSHSPSKNGNADSQRYPWTLRLVKYELDINVLVSLQEWLARFLLIKSNGETPRNEHFLSKNNGGSVHFFGWDSFEDSAVNRTVSTLHGYSLGSTRTVPLIRIIYFHLPCLIVYYYYIINYLSILSRSIMKEFR